MKKADAIKLTTGDRIIFGNSGQTQWSTITQVATVKHVTPRGGILVALKPGGTQWVPYHHVIRRMKEWELDLSENSGQLFD